jgi:hypothetical protein
MDDRTKADKTAKLVADPEMAHLQKWVSVFRCKVFTQTPVHIKGFTNHAFASPDVAKQYGLTIYATFAAANEDRARAARPLRTFCPDRRNKVSLFMTGKPCL